MLDQGGGHAGALRAGPARPRRPTPPAASATALAVRKLRRPGCHGARRGSPDGGPLRAPGDGLRAIAAAAGCPGRPGRPGGPSGVRVRRSRARPGQGRAGTVKSGCRRPVRGRGGGAGIAAGPERGPELVRPATGRADQQLQRVRLRPGRRSGSAARPTPSRSAGSARRPGRSPRRWPARRSRSAGPRMAAIPISRGEHRQHHQDADDQRRSCRATRTPRWQNS